MSLYNDILKKLRKTGMLDLMEYRKLSRKELDSLGDEIRYWCTYGNGKLEKLGKEKKTNQSWLQNLYSSCAMPRQLTGEY